MSIVGFIVVGDRTSHSGVVVSGDITFTIAGQPVARMGDKVFCTRCNKMRNEYQKSTIVSHWSRSGRSK